MAFRWVCNGLQQRKALSQDCTRHMSTAKLLLLLVDSVKKQKTRWTKSELLYHPWKLSLHDTVEAKLGSCCRNLNCCFLHCTFLDRRLPLPILLVWHLSPAQPTDFKNLGSMYTTKLTCLGFWNQMQIIIIQIWIICLKHGWDIKLS